MTDHHTSMAMPVCHHTGMATPVSREASQSASQPPGHAPPAHTHTGTPPDWRHMTRGDFNTDAPAPALFDLEPGQVTADDGHGTGDLLELLEEAPM